jgi:bacterioferritin
MTSHDNLAPSDPIHDLLNSLIGGYWTALAQHQAHIALLESWGLRGLAADMRTHIDDEPITLRQLTDRLLDLDGTPSFTIAAPTIGSTLREVLSNDYERQRTVRPALNAAAEQAAAAHDATTRRLIENILADEEAHLSWLQTELSILDRVGDALYTTSRLGTTRAPAAALRPLTLL